MKVPPTSVLIRSELCSHPPASGYFSLQRIWHTLPSIVSARLMNQGSLNCNTYTAIRAEHAQRYTCFNSTATFHLPHLQEYTRDSWMLRCLLRFCLCVPGSRSLHLASRVWTWCVPCNHRGSIWQARDHAIFLWNR